ncbi:MAG TPA: tryptophan 7-halogenase [Gammaproteobacteria bacterium]|nr:tryptophan 7-halogenase [Gammaproteobacteria bacterium]
MSSPPSVCVPSRVLIVGGGTAGWMCAALLHHAWSPLGTRVTLIESDAIGIIGVGEGSTPKMRRFFARLGISEEEWMPACNASYKCGIRFPHWSTRPGYESYYHPFFTASDDPYIRGFHHNARLRQHGIDVQANPDHYFPSNWAAKRRRAPLPPARLGYQADYAYHFDARLIGEFLRRWATARGVEHLVDTVTAVERRADGGIASVTAARRGPLSAELYVDCTGFASLLICRTLAVPFLSYKPYLFNDRAVAMPTPHEDPASLPSETLSLAMNCGWAWKIPLTNRYGNGYVYASDHLDEAAAERELRAHLKCFDDKVEARHLKMRVGRVERSWEHNCVAIGLAQGFVEPLEATALMIVQDTIEQLVAAHATAGDGRRRQDEFNQKVNRIYDAIRDYLYVHYKLSSRSDTAYWIAARENPTMSDSVASIFEVWDSGGDLLAEIQRQSAQMAYSPTSWFCILAGMGRFPKKPRKPTHKHHAVDPEAARKACLELVQQFPDHRSVLDGMRARIAPAA